MILDKEVLVKMNAKHISRYRSIGYECNVGDLVMIEIGHLPKYSKCEINVKCDDCGDYNKILYINYTKLIEKFEKYRCFKCGKEQAKKTSLSRYGVDNPSKCKEISNRISQTHKMKTDSEKNEMLEKQKETLHSKYGSWFTQTDEYRKKIKKTSIEKYGVPDYRSSDIFKNKVRETLLDRYGVSFLSHIPDFKLKSWFGNKINGEYKDIRYQGTYELDFLERYYERLNIGKVEPIRYKHNDKYHYYHPDFYIPDYNLIVEIKSTYTYNYDLDRNQAKRDYSIRAGYNFMFIIDKDYTDFEGLL